MLASIDCLFLSVWHLPGSWYNEEFFYQELDISGIMTLWNLFKSHGGLAQIGSFLGVVIVKQGTGVLGQERRRKC